MAYATIAQFRDYMEQVPTYQQQTLTLTGSPAGGTFTLTYEGQTTGAIAYNASSTTLQTALQALSTIGSNGATVKGPAGGPWIINFTVEKGRSPLILANNSLTGGASPSLTIANTADAKIQDILDRVTEIIDQELGYSFGTAATSTRVVYGDGTDYLLPPAFVAGSVTGVTAPSGYSVPSYVELDGILVVKDSSGVLAPITGRSTLSGSIPTGNWLPGVPYTVSANFGYGSVPKDIVEACLEVAVRIWKGRDAGFSDVVGVEGSGAVGYNGKFPALVKEILANRQQRSMGIH
jgi:hypothetical protein